MQLLISSVRNSPDALFSKNDAATRLLLTSGDFSDRVAYQLAYHVPNTKNATLISYPSVEGLPWRERLRRWTRWTTPISKENHNTNELDIKKAPSILVSTPSRSQEHPTSMKKLTAKPSEEGDGSTYWASDLFTETSALMGSVIHSSLSPMPSSPSSAPPMKLADDYMVHSYSTHIPNISRVLSKSTTSLHNKDIQRIILRFQPNPFYQGTPVKGAIGAAALAAFPPIEMIFDVADNDLNITKLKYVQAIVSESKTDIMLPDNAVDLRFQQRTTSRLKRRYIDQVREFLKKSKLSLKGAGALETPPSIILPISSHICREPGFKLLDAKHPKSKSNQPEEDFREVEYLFTGLEVRRTLGFQYKGWLLLYTSVEAGKAGGRRGELRLRPSQFQKVAKEEDFVQMAYNLAHILGGGSEEDFAVRKVEVSDKKDPLVRRLVTNKSKVDRVFKYFATRPLEWSGDDGGEERGWEESERVDEEVEGDVDGEEADFESEGDQEAGYIKSRE
jgi:hypothetical protein